MKKIALLSLLAIPIFSLATTFNSFSATTFNSYQESKKIKPKTVATAVIEFLLRNPKTADKMNPTEQIALDIIGDLLKTQDQREHEIEYATAGRGQLTINTTDGRQAQFVRDESGNIYLVMDGVIHPIAQELVNQARSLPAIENVTLPPYNLGDLESIFNSNIAEDIHQIYIVQQEGGEYLSDIAKKFDIPASIIDVIGPIYEKRKMRYRTLSEQREIQEDRKKLPKGESLLIVKEGYKNQILAIFSYRWDRDLNRDGKIGFDEFNQIKRTFYDDEDFNIGIPYQTKIGFKGNLELKIFDDYTGNLMVDEKLKILSNGPKVGQQPIPAGSLPIGVYLIYINLINYYSDRVVSSKSEKFEIIQNPSKTAEKK
ncbi:MAG: hypothetical protein ACFFDN_39860 [Candidatus Hodarchaeota archaeon]